MDKAEENQPCLNTDVEIWRQDLNDPLDPDNCYAPKISITKDNKISIKSGGRVCSRTAKEWVNLGWSTIEDESAQVLANLQQNKDKKFPLNGFTRTSNFYPSEEELKEAGYTLEGLNQYACELENLIQGLSAKSKKKSKYASWILLIKENVSCINLG
ncbi:MAG: hypothetical protein AAGA83_00255 [Cyanobacteria bacterium P01_F01_bin.116]